MTTLIRLENLKFGWSDADLLLDIPHFELQKGEHVFLEGQSGSGKSTLLSLITGVLLPNAGEILFGEEELTKASAPRRDKIRADHMGVIFQLFNLLPYLSVVENVTLPCRFSKRRRQAAITKSGSPKAEAMRLLERLGLDDPKLLKRNTSDLSVGQQQRVAAARAVIGNPDLIIADEPTSALDTAHRDNFLKLLLEEASTTNATLLFVSHDEHLGSAFDTRLSMTAFNPALMAKVTA